MPPSVKARRRNGAGRGTGEAALQYATDLALDMAARKDEIDAETWRQIAMAVAELQRNALNGERLN